MITKFFNGKYYNKVILSFLYNEIFFYNFFIDKKLILLILLIGNNFSSNLYVKNKIHFCYKININCLLLKFSITVKMSTLKKIISILNNDIFINSVLIQFPVLKHLNKLSLLNSIKFVKDVDLLNPFNFGCYMSNYFNIIIPSTAASILFILEKMKIRKCGTKSLIFGFSNIVGKPIVLELMSLGLTISIVSKMDKQYINIVKNSDLIILAVGIANFFSISSVSYGAIVIDIGINESFSDFVIGDSFLDNNEDIASFIVPVPGGVGPLTVSSLLFNFVKLYVNKNFTIVV